MESLCRKGGIISRLFAMYLRIVLILMIRVRIMQKRENLVLANKDISDQLKTFNVP